jgi:hypothetical protein
VVRAAVRCSLTVRRIPSHLTPCDESWDDIAVVRYANLETLQKIIAKPEYEAEAAPHRRAALQNWRFVATTAFKPPVRASAA